MTTTMMLRMVMKNLMAVCLSTTPTAMIVWRTPAGIGITGGTMTGSLMNPSMLLPARMAHVGHHNPAVKYNKLFYGVSILMMLISTTW